MAITSLLTCNRYVIFHLLLCVTHCMASEWKESRRNNPPGIIASYEDFQFIETKKLSSKRQTPLRKEQQQLPNTMEDNSCVSSEAADSLKMKFDKNLFSKTFTNDSQTNISFSWTGDDDSIILVVTMNNINKPSTLYVSENCGKTFENLTPSLNNMTITSVQQSPVDRKLVILMAYSKPQSSYSTIFLVTNGSHVNQISLPFKLYGNIKYHPSNQKLLLALGEDKTILWKAWLSSDGGHNWREVQKSVNDIQWSQDPNDGPDTFYFSNGSELVSGEVIKKAYDLVKATNLAKKFVVVEQRVRTFQIAGKFLYALVYNNEERKKSILKVSTNGGIKWNEAQLPITVEDQFYEILDMSDGMVFIHVDKVKDEGYGTLFTSDADGIIFSESLRDHVYLKNGVNDFYKVRSMRGVYITTQVSTDNNKISVITYNRGAKWNMLKSSLNECPYSGAKSCALKIANKREATQIPMGSLSAKSAIGLILSHGYGSDSVTNVKPNVYVSSDGGYNWKKALTGPHLFAIADHGGLLVAVPYGNNQTSDTVKFSFDEGETWYCYKFTEEIIKVTGLLTDPESWSLKVGIWGYGLVDSLLKVTVIDFQPIIEKQCKEPLDFMNFTAHNEMAAEDKTQQGCLLGAKETFRKVKKGSRCYLGRTHSVNRSTEHCKCTEDDYECDFGFYRQNNWKQCVENPSFKGAELDVCVDGEEKKIVTYGYRKIPGDVCENGYDPGDRYEKNIQVKCREGDKILLGGLQVGPSNSVIGVVILIILIIAMTGLIFGMSVFFIRKFQQINASPVTYRYSRLSQDACDEETMCIVTNNLGITIGSSDEDDGSQPATLLVDTSDAMDGIIIRSNGNANRNQMKKYIEESDEELLQ